MYCVTWIGHVKDQGFRSLRNRQSLSFRSGLGRQNLPLVQVWVFTKDWPVCIEASECSFLLGIIQSKTALPQRLFIPLSRTSYPHPIHNKCSKVPDCYTVGTTPSRVHTSPAYPSYSVCLSVLSLLPLTPVRVLGPSHADGRSPNSLHPSEIQCGYKLILCLPLHPHPWLSSLFPF